MAKILVIDDSPDVRILMEQVLGREYEVHTVSDWASANPYIFKDNMDLILIDVNMPGVKGDQIAQVLGDTVTKKKLRIALFSNLDRKILRKKARESGAIGYLSKDFEPTVLLGRIEKLLKTELV